MVDINTHIDFEKIISKKGFLDLEVDPTLDLFAEIEKLKQENAAKAKEMAELKARLDRIEKTLKAK